MPENKQTVFQTLQKIQKELKAPKGQKNTHGNYNYRNCEDILEAVKPLLGNCVVIITDKIVKKGDRFYIRATARITDGKKKIPNVAYAREVKERKGMDASQITGATSSYARKYALNGLFAIDDTKDADTQDNSVSAPQAQPRDQRTTPTAPPRPALASPAQRGTILHLGAKLGHDETNTFAIVVKHYKLPGITSLTMEQASKIIETLKGKVAKKEQDTLLDEPGEQMPEAQVPPTTPPAPPVNEEDNVTEKKIDDFINDLDADAPVTRGEIVLLESLMKKKATEMKKGYDSIVKKLLEKMEVERIDDLTRKQVLKLTDILTQKIEAEDPNTTVK